MMFFSSETIDILTQEDYDEKHILVYHEVFRFAYSIM